MRLGKRNHIKMAAFMQAEITGNRSKVSMEKLHKHKENILNQDAIKQMIK